MLFSLGWCCIGVVLHWCGAALGWCCIGVVLHWGGAALGWACIGVVLHWGVAACSVVLTKNVFLALLCTLLAATMISY